MTSPRKEFLLALFRILEQAAIPFCVLRNYDDIYENLSSDVDIAVEPEHFPRFKDCLAQAAWETNHKTVLQARYINFSYVYWHPEGGFLRIDIETEVRWRIFPVLTAKSIVGLRRKHESFYVPHPRHESVILFVAALWRGSLSERYRKQLAALYQQLAAPNELNRTFQSVFGKAGSRLLALLQQGLKESGDRKLWRTLKLSLVRNAFRDGPNRRALLDYLVGDTKRFWERLRRPSGISWLYASASPRRRDMDNLFRQLEFLYPSQKSIRFGFHASGETTVNPRLGLRFRLNRLYTLFKGGLCLRLFQLSRDSDLKPILRVHSRYLFPSRTFVSAEDSKGQVYLGHVKTGFMTCLAATGAEPVPNGQIIQFISTILERNRVRRRGRKRGVFVVLVGLDGSGKTTVARNLCCMGVNQEVFHRIRYFHWRPEFLGGVAFPWPEFQNVPRKKTLKRSPLQSVLSVARLLKNLAWANISYFFLIKPLLRRRALVLIDRYYYNYYLDPVSVKYYGPRWLIDRVRPLFPRPDLVVVFKAAADVLLARKQELSKEDISRQRDILEELDFAAQNTFTVDASNSADEVSREVFEKIVQITNR